MADSKNSGAGWRGKNSGRGSKKTAASLQRAIGLLIFTIIAIVGVIIGLVFVAVPTPDTSVAGFWVSKYSDPRLTSDPSSEADEQAFKSGGYLKIPAEGFGDSWSQTSALIKEKKPTEPILVYISAAACIGETGDVLILPGSANPENRADWLTLKEVLTTVKESKSKEKLVILDIHRPIANPSIGFLTNDVAGRVSDEVASLPDAGRLVLMSCGDGQVSLSSELLGRSIFNFYVEEGLRGWADESKDGVIHARELAGFVKSRVEDWAKRVRNEAQSPTLLGAKDFDFKLRVLPTSSTPKHLTDEPILKTALNPAAASKSADTAETKTETKKESPAGSSETIVTYPKFLLDGWLLAQTWRKARADQYAPRPLSRLEAALLKAEYEWRFAREESVVGSELRTRIDAASRQYEKSTKMSRPDPLPSVALEVTLVAPPNPGLIQETKALFLRRAQKNKLGLPDEVLLPDVKAFFDKNKPANEAELSAAVLDALTTADVRQKAMFFDLIKFADLVLREYRSANSKESVAPYVETLFLQQIIALAPTPTPPAPNAPPGPVPVPPWSNGVLFEAVHLVWRGEKLDAQADAFPWILPLVDKGATQRHVAEVMLRSPGYVLPDEIDKARNTASTLDQQLEVLETEFLKARRVLALAQATLPAYQAYLERIGDEEIRQRWLETTEKATTLASLLLPPSESDARTQWTREEFTRGRVEEWRSVSEAVRISLDTLLKPFSPAQIEARILAARAPAAPPEAFDSIEAILATPFVPAESRGKLIEAAQQLDRALHKKHFDASSFTATASDLAGGQTRELKRSRERADRSIALLNLGGVDTTSLSEPRRAFATKLDTATRDALTKALWPLWKSIPDRLQAEKDLSILDRISRILPPLQVVSSLDNESDEFSTPTTRLRRDREAQLWNWLAGFYSYLENDIDASRVVADASDALTSFAKDRTTRTTFKIEPDPSTKPPVLTTQEPKGVASLRLTLGEAASGKEGKPTIRVLTPPDSKLDVILPELPPLEPQQPVKYPITIELKQGGDEAPNPNAVAAPAPRGLLVEVMVGGRPYFSRPDVNFGTALDPLKLIVTDDPKSAAANKSAIGLRTISSKQRMYVWVKNPTAKARNVEVRLLANGDDSPIGTAKLRVEPGATTAVSSFTVPAPAQTAVPPAAPAGPAATELRSTTGLEIRLLDADLLDVSPQTALLDVAKPVIDLIPASDLIKVEEVKYTPRNEKNGFRNQLVAKIRAKTSLADGPCSVSLVLPPELIPGLQGQAASEQLSGVLKEVNDVIELSAKGIPLDQGNNDSAAFFITVDGDERALKYKTNFDREGDVPRTPILDNRPDFRLVGKPLAEVRQPYPVSLAVDNPPDDRSTLVVGFLTMQDGKPTLRFDQTVPARRKRIAVTPEPKGALAFEASIGDQLVNLATTGLSGPVRVRATLLNGRARIEGTPKDLDLILDSLPEIDSFEIVKGSSALNLQLRASAKSQSGIDTVRFFVGLPVDDKIPSEKDAVPGLRQPDDSWAARLSLPKDAKGRVALGVEFVNKLGKRRYQRLDYDVPASLAMTKGAAPGSEDPAAMTGAVTGKVSFGEIDQPNLKVGVYNNKAEEIASATTDPKGVFTIKDLKPGNYTLYVSRVENNSEAVSSIAIKAGETTTRNLEMRAK